MRILSVVIGGIIGGVLVNLGLWIKYEVDITRRARGIEP
jgi:formate/nitrite transporter FocA (FNT family)